MAVVVKPVPSTVDAAGFNKTGWGDESAALVVLGALLEMTVVRTEVPVVESSG